MSKFFEVIKRGCFYAVILSFAIYAISGISGLVSTGMPWHRFLVVVAYGVIISFASWLNKILPFKSVYKLGINFLFNLVGFVLVYMVVVGIDNFNPARFFVLLALFTVCYVIITLLIKMIKRIPFRPKEATEQKASFKGKPEQVYRPRYSDEE